MSIDTRPNLGYDRFVEEWRKLPELQDDYTVHLAWRRYQMVLHHTHDYVPSDNDPSTTEFKSIFSDLLSAEVESIDTYKFMKLSPNSVPWTATGLRLKSGQMVSTFASGRVWRSELLDMSLNPQFALWFKVGVDGTVFNSTRDSNTFKAVTEGELYVAIQYPGLC